jgi:hypothetical protein
MVSRIASLKQALSMLIFILYLLLCIFAPLTTSISFSFDLSNSEAPCAVGLVCEGGAFRNPMMDMNPRTFSTGRVSYAQPVRLWDAETGELGSFTTTFSFSIYAADSGSMLGDGVAFFLGHYPSSIPTNSWGGNLALMDLNNNRNVVGDKRIVAVEFDTLGNTDFPDVMGSYHMGIDINSIVSVAYTNISNDLRAGDVMTARISYDNVTQVLADDLRIGGTSYHVNETVNLRNNLPEEVAVGFSASTGLAIEVNKVLSWTFNSTLTGTDKRTTRRPRKKLLAAAILPPAVFVLCVVLLCFWVWRLKATRWKKSNGGDEDSGPEEEDEEEAEFVRGVGPKRYGYRRLMYATGNFAEGNKLGRGGFGSVYKGELADQDGLVAVKMLSPESSGQGRKEFEAEVKIISQLRHRNLVRLLGWCDSLIAKEDSSLVMSVSQKEASTDTSMALAHA